MVDFSEREELGGNLRKLPNLVKHPKREIKTIRLYIDLQFQTLSLMIIRFKFLVFEC